MNGSFERPNPLYKLTELILVVSIVFGIGWIRFLTGPEFAFSLFYLFPIIVFTWRKGLFGGILISLLSAISWLIGDLYMVDRFSRPHVPFFNVSFRLAVFLFIVFLIVRYKRIMESLKTQAMMDPLTGITNRRAFFQLAKTEIDRSRRYDNPFSVLVLDIDDFKQINDQFGHHTGDDLLITVGETIKQHVRAIDIVSRFGGDEFVILLIKTNRDAAFRIAQKIRQQLLYTMQKHHWPVTFSMGLVTFLFAPETVDETIKVADELMYQVKNNGKDDVKHMVMQTKSAMSGT